MANGLVGYGCGGGDDAAVFCMSSCVVLGGSTSSIGEEDSSLDVVEEEEGNGKLRLLLLRITRWTCSSAWSNAAGGAAASAHRSALTVTRVGNRAKGAASANGARHSVLRRIEAFISSERFLSAGGIRGSNK